MGAQFSILCVIFYTVVRRDIQNLHNINLAEHPIHSDLVGCPYIDNHKGPILYEYRPLGIQITLVTVITME